MEQTNGERIIAFKAACENGAEAGAGHILLRILPAGNHKIKRNALPDFIRAVAVSCGGASFQSPQPLTTVISSIPKTENGDENVAIEAIMKASKFLGLRL